MKLYDDFDDGDGGDRIICTKISFPSICWFYMNTY